MGACACVRARPRLRILVLLLCRAWLPPLPLQALAICLGSLDGKLADTKGFDTVMGLREKASTSRSEWRERLPSFGDIKAKFGK